MCYSPLCWSKRAHWVGARVVNPQGHHHGGTKYRTAHGSWVCRPPSAALFLMWRGAGGLPCQGWCAGRGRCVACGSACREHRIYLWNHPAPAPVDQANLAAFSPSSPSAARVGYAVQGQLTCLRYLPSQRPFQGQGGLTRLQEVGHGRPMYTSGAWGNLAGIASWQTAPGRMVERAEG